MEKNINKNNLEFKEKKKRKKKERKKLYVNMKNENN